MIDNVSYEWCLPNTPLHNTQPLSCRFNDIYTYIQNRIISGANILIGYLLRTSVQVSTSIDGDFYLTNTSVHPVLLYMTPIDPPDKKQPFCLY